MLVVKVVIVAITAMKAVLVVITNVFIVITNVIQTIKQSLCIISRFQLGKYYYMYHLALLKLQ